MKVIHAIKVLAAAIPVDAICKDVPWATLTGVVVVKSAEAVKYLPSESDMSKTIILSLISGASIIVGKYLMILAVKLSKRLYTDAKQFYKKPIL